MSDTPRLTPPSTYLDFGALGQLRGEASRDPGKAVRATAEQCEAFFIQQMLKTMRDAVEKSELVDNGKADLYQDLMDKEVSLQMTRRGGIGLADMLEKQMNRLQPLPCLCSRLSRRCASSLQRPGPTTCLPADRTKSNALTEAVHE